MIQRKQRKSEQTQVIELNKIDLQYKLSLVRQFLIFPHLNTHTTAPRENALHRSMRVEHISDTLRLIIEQVFSGFTITKEMIDQQLVEQTVW